MKKEFKVVCEECKNVFSVRVDMSINIKEIEREFCPFCEKEVNISGVSLIYTKK